MIRMDKIKSQKFVIKYDERKLSDKRSKRDFLFRILKESNSMIKSGDRTNTNDLLLSELQSYLDQKQSVCGNRTNQLKQLVQELDNLQLLIANQKDLTVKNYQKVDIFIDKIESETKNELSTLKKQRIQKQIQFAQKIDHKLEKLTFDISQSRQLNQQKHKNQWNQSIKLVSERIHSTKKKQHELNMKITQDQNELVKRINHKVLQVRGMLGKLKQQGSRLDQVLNEIEQFHKVVLCQIRYMKQERCQKEQHTIQVIQQIISSIDSQNLQQTQTFTNDSL